MRGGRRLGAAIVIAACLCGFSAFAGADAAPAFLLFSGTDLWRDGAFMYGGVLWSPEGLNEPGFALKALVSGGGYRYSAGALGGATVKGRELTAQFLPGWRFKQDKFEITLFAGIDLENHHLTPFDPESSLKGNDAGLRAAFSAWAEPTPGSMMAMDGSVSTIANGYALHGAVGWRVADLFYLGPEAGVFACAAYHQSRVGLHFTGFKFNDTEWSAAAGWESDTDSRSGPYVRLGVLVRR